jgi:hypothetical protein
METIGHHTCNKSGGESYVVSEGPFKSVIKKNDKGKISMPFLGEGYYYWDDNLDMAILWGRIRYKKGFYVILSDLNLTPDVFLDLVGNRKQMKYLIKLMEQTKKSGLDKEKWTIGAFIEFVKVLRKYQKDVFPFEIIRAIDSSIDAKEQQKVYYFVQGKPNYIDLQPRIAICLISKNDLYLRTKMITYRS